MCTLLSIVSVDEFKYKTAPCTRFFMKVILVFFSMLSVDEVKLMVSVFDSFSMNDNLPTNEDRIIEDRIHKL